VLWHSVNVELFTIHVVIDIQSHASFFISFTVIKVVVKSRLIIQTYLFILSVLVTYRSDYGHCQCL